MNSDNLCTDHQLFVGHGDGERIIGVGSEKIRGGGYIQGPVLMGDDAAFNYVEATVMIAPIRNIDLPDIPVSPTESFYRKQAGKAFVDTSPPFIVDPVTQEIIPIGDKRYIPGILPAEIPETEGGGIYCEPLENLALVVKGGAKVVEDFHVAGNIFSYGEVMSQCGAHVLSAKKNFDIPHPTKDGWRLRHTCLEGPSNDVYFRGRLSNKNIINLPEYWEKLVDPASITVSITPIGAHQDIIVKRIGGNEIALQSKSGIPINCFYHVFGERTDGEKLIVEYEGTDPGDYPGNNNEYSISGYHYDTKK